MHTAIVGRRADLVVVDDILPTTSRAGGEPLTMSSREIAELLGTRHDSVKRTVERLVERGVVGVPPLVEYHDTLGRKAREYRLDKRSSLIVVAQLSPEFTARVVDRWQELEAQVAKALKHLPLYQPQTRVEQVLLQLAEEQEQRAIAAEDKLAIAEPKAQALDELVEADGTFTLTAAAKNFGISPRKEFIRVLVEWGVLYQRSKNSPLLPAEWALQRGYFVVRTENRGGFVAQQTRVTAKGMGWIATKLHRFQRKAA